MKQPSSSYRNGMRSISLSMHEFFWSRSTESQRLILFIFGGKRMIQALQSWYGRIDQKHHHIAFRQNIRLLWGTRTLVWSWWQLKCPLTAMWRNWASSAECKVMDAIQGIFSMRIVACKINRFSEATNARGNSSLCQPRLQVPEKKRCMLPTM